MVVEITIEQLIKKSDFSARNKTENANQRMKNEKQIQSKYQVKSIKFMCAPRKYLSLNFDKSSNTKDANCLKSTIGEYYYICIDREIHIDLNIQKPINMSKIITVKAKQTRNERRNDECGTKNADTYIDAHIYIGIE